MRERVAFLYAAAATCIAVAAPSASAQDLCANAGVRVQQDATHLPDCRAYEKVSPAEKMGAAIHSEAVLVSADGNMVRYASGQAFGDATGAAAATEYRTTRGPFGWGAASAISTSGEVGPVGGRVTRNELFTDDLSKSVLVSNGRLLPEAEPGVYHLYHQDLVTKELSLISASSSPLTPVPFETAPFAFGSSADLRTVYFATGTNRTPDATGADVKVYRSVDGDVSLASILPSGDPAAGAVAPGGIVGTSPHIPIAGVTNTVSDDGSRVFFSAPAPEGAGPLFVREYGANGAGTTTQIDLPQRPDSGPDPEGPLPARFQWATDDGSVVLFTSCEKLTEDATAATNPVESGCRSYGIYSGGRSDLYRYDVETGELTDLTTTDPTGAAVERVLGVSDDMSRIYFSAQGNLTPDAAGDGMKIYLYDDGEISLVGVGDRLLDYYGGSLPGERVTPDGRYLMLLSADRLIDYDNLNPACGLSDGVCNEVYLYDAERDEIVCPSCAIGAVPSDNAYIQPPRNSSTGARVLTLSRAISEDGRRLFFSSPDRLVAGDSNGSYDAYQYDIASGDVSLLSSGRGGESAYFGDADRSGDNVFLTTDAALLPEDGDGAFDLYSARVGGGFPSPPGDRPGCAGDTCQGPLVGGPASAPIGTGTPHPQGAPPPRRAASLAVARVGPAAARRLARGRAATVRVRVNRPGQVRLLARAKIGGRARVVARAAKRAPRAGRLALRVRLVPVARRALRAGKELRIRLTVRFADAAPRRVELRLRPPEASSSGSGNDDERSGHDR